MSYETLYCCTVDIRTFLYLELWNFVFIFQSRGSINTEPSSNDDSTFIDRLSPGKKRIL